MAKFKKVRFLKYFNRPPVFVAIEIDTVLVFLAAFFVPYVSITFSAIFSQTIAFVMSVTSTAVVTYLFVKYKNEFKKSYLKHKLYINNLYRVNIKKYKKEVKAMDVDVEDYYPHSNIKIFTE